MDVGRAGFALRVLGESAKVEVVVDEINVVVVDQVESSESE